MVRISPLRTAPDGFAALNQVDAYLNGALDPVILELVKVRASLINGCAACTDAHIHKLVKLEVPQRKINMIGFWRDTDFFSEEEQVALALAEEVTDIAGGVSDETWAAAVDLFGEKTTVDLVLAIGVINVWNRVYISSETQPPRL